MCNNITIFLFLAENVLSIKNWTNLNPQLFKKKCVFLLVTRIVCNEFLLRQVSEAMHPDGILNSELRPLDICTKVGSIEVRVIAGWVHVEPPAHESSSYL